MPDNILGTKGIVVDKIKTPPFWWLYFDGESVKQTKKLKKSITAKASDKEMNVL